MNAHHDWLRSEVEKWRAEGLIDAPLAGRLLARYPAAPDRAWGRIVFSAVGAVLIGLGVTLFFAYNWADIPKAIKLAVVFAAVLGAHGSAMAVAARPDAPRALVEGLHVAGTMLFGAGIFLVAQVYHIDEHYPNAFLAWCLGALALAWAVPSMVQGLLAVVLVAVWAGIEAVEFSAPMHAAPVLVAAGTLPLAWWRRWPSLLFCSLAVTLVVTGFAVAWVGGEALLPVLLLLGAGIAVAGIASGGSDFPGAEIPARACGLAAVLLCVYVLSFKQGARALHGFDLEKPEAIAYLAVAVVAYVAAHVALWRSGVQRLDGYSRALVGVLAGASLFTLAAVLVLDLSGGWPVALPFNVVALGLAAVLILDGSERQRPWVVGAGCAIFAIVTMSRYVDLFSSLLTRAAVFVALGVGIFLVGNFYSQRRRELEGGRA